MLSDGQAMPGAFQPQTAHLVIIIASPCMRSAYKALGEPHTFLKSVITTATRREYKRETVRDVSKLFDCFKSRFHLIS